MLFDCRLLLDVVERSFDEPLPLPSPESSVQGSKVSTAAACVASPMLGSMLGIINNHVNKSFSTRTHTHVITLNVLVSRLTSVCKLGLINYADKFVKFTAERGRTRARMCMCCTRQDVPSAILAVML